ncbi:MAG: nitrate/nitrite transporter NrtS [Candidatus Schekmanbacteria bacterium]|nr:nitrate/nitrite transporter NrtS [Candidatus Schekmanbacteria bacterium]
MMSGHDRLPVTTAPTLSPNSAEPREGGGIPPIADLCRVVTRRMILRSVLTAVAVGGLLFAINSGAAVAREGMTSGLATKLLLTMLIPFLVSLSSAAITRHEMITQTAAAGACAERRVRR